MFPLACCCVSLWEICVFLPGRGSKISTAGKVSDVSDSSEDRRVLSISTQAESSLILHLRTAVMGQTSSNLSLLSRKSAGTNSVSSCIGSDYVDSEGKKFVRTSALNQPLIFNPHTSAHKTFKQYLASNSSKKQRKTSNRSDSSTISTCDTSNEMPIPLYLQPQDINNIRDSWATVERQLFNLGVRVFISLLENQPTIKRTFRQYRSKRHSELRINEDLQKLILYLICGLKRVVKHLNDSKALTKYLRRVAKKHSPTDIDFGRINPAEVSSVFCSAIKEIAPTDAQTWTREVSTTKYTCYVLSK